MFGKLSASGMADHLKVSAARPIPKMVAANDTYGVSSLSLQSSEASKSIRRKDMPNLKSYNEKLVAYLRSQGLNINPQRLRGTKTRDQSLQVFLTGNGPILFLPHVSTKKKNDGSTDEQEEEEPTEISTTDLTIGDPTPAQANVDRVTHVFAVILKLSKPHSLKHTVTAKFETTVATQWPQGVPRVGKNGKSRVVNKEDYKVAKDLVWDLDLRSCDCFIPFKDHTDDNEDEDLHFHFQETDSVVTSSTSSDSSTILVSKEPTQDIRYLEMLPSSSYEDSDDGEERSINSGGRIFNPGYYIFNLPVLFPVTMPESVLTPNAQIEHHLSVKLEKLSLPAIQPPAAAFLSTSPHHHFDDEPISPVTSNNSTNGLFSSLSPKSGSFLKALGNHASAPKRKLSLRSKSPPRNSSLSFRHRLPVIRLPPSDSATTLNKSIYVNKVWNDAMNYEILFPRKYVQLSPASGLSDDIVKSSSFNLQIKIIPLVKTLSVKRVRINILEKMTYISQDQKYELDVGKIDSSGIKERSVTLFEVKTKEKGTSSALRSEVIKGCVNDNLLTSCFNNGHLAKQPPPLLPAHRNRSLSNSFFSSSSSSSSTLNKMASEDIIITNPVKVKAPLVFHAADDFDFIKDLHDDIIKSRTDISDLVEEDEGNDLTSIFSNGSQTDLTSQMSNNSAVIDDELESGNALKSIFSKGLDGGNSRKSSFGTTPKPKKAVNDYGLYPDVTFHNIKVRHRLQICFRISKPDDKEQENGDPPKIHHYEVIVDTPLVLVSPFCVGESVELPSYDTATSGPPRFSISLANENEYEDEEQLPSFEEAVLQPASPMMASMMNRLANSTTSMASDYNVNSTQLLSASPLSIGMASPSMLPMSSYDARRDRSSTLNNIDALMTGGDLPLSQGEPPSTAQTVSSTLLADDPPRGLMSDLQHQETDLSPSMTRQSECSLGDEPPSYTAAVTEDVLKKSLLDDQDDEGGNSHDIFAQAPQYSRPGPRRLNTGDLSDDVQTLSGMEPANYGSPPVKAYNILDN